MNPNISATPRSRAIGRLLNVALAAALTMIAITGFAPAASSATTGCRINWGSLPESATDTTTGDVTSVRTGRHQCFDRLVIDIDGDPAGYQVEYVTSLTADGSGAKVPVAGGAIIRIIAHAAAYDDNGAPTVDSGKVSAIDVARYQTFRDVEWAGSFEGHTTLGLGVRARLPFRVFTIDGPGDGSRLVIDVAHRW